MNMTQAKSTMAAALAGAVVTILLWIFTLITKIQVPEEVIESFTTITMVFILYKVHQDPKVAAIAADIQAEIPPAVPAQQ